MTLKQKIDFAFIAGFLVLLLITFATYRSTHTVTANFERINTTQKVLLHLNRILTLAIDVETGQRGYVISGDERFLEPMVLAKEQLKPSLDTLDRLLDGEKNPHAAELKRMITRKVELSDKAVDLRKIGQQNEAVSFIASGLGKTTMDSIRTIKALIEADEVMNLELRSSESLSNTLYSDQNFILLTLLIASFVFIVYYIIRKNAKRLIQYQEGQKILIDELTKKNHQLDDFAHITSHNIRSSSGNISGLVGLLDEESSKEEYTQILQQLRIVANNLTLTLNELVDTLQVRQDVNIERQSIQFEEIFNKVKNSLSAEIIQTNAIIVGNFSQTPSIEYPRVYLESILHNLLSNALKYRHPDRVAEISISTFRKNNKTVMNVSDNGLGIDLKKFGESFFGFRKTFHYHPQARGIGLFMTKAQLEALGGSITVESEPDKGTTFTVIF
jgi:CHASE3 domain sensor protein/two-component sensor histidine kinase